MFTNATEYKHYVDIQITMEARDHPKLVNFQFCRFINELSKNDFTVLNASL